MSRNKITTIDGLKQVQFEELTFEEIDIEKGSKCYLFQIRPSIIINQ